MSRAPVLAFASFAALTASDARADSVSGTRSELLVERAHEIELTMHYGHAELVVQRTVWNGGERHDQAMFFIDMPTEAVAVGLRTKGELHGRPHWFDGELLEAELAAARYQELTGIGGYYPKDPALLSWRSPELLALQVFPCAPQAAKTIEYTVALPTTYEDGRHRIRLPRLGTDQLVAQARLHGDSTRDQLFVDGEPVAEGEVLALDGDHEIALARAVAPRLDGGLATISIGDDRAVFHYDVEAARRLSSVPARADVVVLVDRSRSLAASDITAELSAARAYLAHFEPRRLHARAAVVAFDRKPEDLQRGFVPVGEAIALLEHTELAAKNGSNVDLALQHAERLFDAAPSGRARRIVVLTDRQTRSSLTVARLETLAARTGALVHVADVAAGFEARLERDDTDPWSAVAKATGGVSWHATIDEGATDLSLRRGAFEELARPLRLHGLAVRAPGLGTDDLDLPETLDEGQSLERLLLTDARVPHVVVTGELWAEPVRKVLLPDADEARRWAAFAFGSELLGQLTEPEMMQLALLGRAVSPVTSYLAIEPGVRPSTEGLEAHEAFGVGGLGLSGIGSGGGGSGMGTIGVADPEERLRTELQDALQACGAEGRSATAVLETTMIELVDVVSVAIGRDAVAEACVTERLWKTELDASFTFAFRRWSIAV